MLRSIPAPTCSQVRPPGDGIRCAGACLALSQHSSSISRQWRCRETPAGQDISPGRRRGRPGHGNVVIMGATQQAATQAPPKRLTKQDLVDYLASGCSPSPSQWRCGFADAPSRHHSQKRCMLAGALAGWWARMHSLGVAVCLDIRFAAHSLLPEAGSGAVMCCLLCRASNIAQIPRLSRPCRACRIGTEHEKLAMKAGTMQRAGYDEISHILNGLVSRFGWKPMMEAGELNCVRH